MMTGMRETAVLSHAVRIAHSIFTQTRTLVSKRGSSRADARRTASSLVAGAINARACATLRSSRMKAPPHPSTAVAVVGDTIWGIARIDVIVARRQRFLEAFRIEERTRQRGHRGHANPDGGALG